MELGTLVVGGKAPRDGAALSIALSLQGGDAALASPACFPRDATNSHGQIY